MPIRKLLIFKIAVGIILIVAGAVVVFFIFNTKITTEKTMNRISLPSKTNPKINPNKSENPYFVENMRKRKYDGGRITIERQVGNFGQFTSYLASYPSDGLKIFALLQIPNGAKPQEGYPVVIVNHGYINPEVYSTVSSYRKISDYLVGQGFLVLKPDYRGHGNSEGEASGVLSRINYSVDVLNLIESVKTLPDANDDKIFIYGHSMGGEVALRVLEVTNKVKAATLWAPAATDFPESTLYFVRKHRPEILPELNAEINQYFTRQDFPKVSSIQNTHYINSSLIIHHGTVDSSVPYSWSQELDKKLTQTNTQHTFYTYEGEDHNFTRGSWQTVVNRDLESFAKFL